SAWSADSGNGDRRSAGEKFSGGKHSRERVFVRYFRASRGGGFHLRRGDGIDRIAGREAGVSADQAAVFPGGFGALSVSDGGEQRRNALPREAYRRHGRRRIREDRDARKHGDADSLRERSRAETRILRIR